LELIRPFCGRSVLEIGAGLGEFASGLLDRDRMVLTDSDPLCLSRLQERFTGHLNVDVRPLDLDSWSGFGAQVETVIALNVLEHIHNDVSALSHLSDLLTADGRIVIWVPGYPALYGEFDRKVGHVRRYTPASLQSAFTAAGLHTELVRPVNLLGGLAWWLAVRMGRTCEPKPSLVRRYDRWVMPTTRAIERVVRPPFGQSVLGVARVSR
jgi:SAM-dependent methyltransferase